MSLCLKITRGTMAHLRRSAQRAGRNEFFGILTGKQGDGPIVTGAYLLPADASSTHARAAPETIRQALSDLCARQQKPLGIVHSHGSSMAFHSATDDEATARLLPALAEPNFTRCIFAMLPPMVTDQDEAVVPLADGQRLTVTLLGPELGSTGVRERVAWTDVTTSFRSAAKSPRATMPRANLLQLEAGHVILRLGLPPSVSLIHRIVDDPVRRATVFSLVLNRRGDTYAEALEIFDIEGRSVMHQQACPVEVIGKTSLRWKPNRDFVAYAETVAGDGQGKTRQGTVLQTWDGNGHDPL